MLILCLLQQLLILGCQLLLLPSVEEGLLELGVGPCPHFSLGGQLRPLSGDAIGSSLLMGFEVSALLLFLHSDLFDVDLGFVFADLIILLMHFIVEVLSLLHFHRGALLSDMASVGLSLCLLVPNCGVESVLFLIGCLILVLHFDRSLHNEHNNVVHKREHTGSAANHQSDEKGRAVI